MDRMIASLCAVGLLVAGHKPRASFDLEHYSVPSPCRPYGARLGIRFLRRSRTVWLAVSIASLFVFAGAIEYRFGVWPALLVLGLPMVRFAAQFPCTPDAISLALFALLLVYPEAWWIALVGGLFSERVPVFGALATASLWPLLGLIPFAIGWAISPRASGNGWLTNPLASGLAVRERLLNPFQMWLPWGVLLLGVGGVSALGAVTLAVAYAQLLVAHDVARLYQWAFVPLVLGLQSVPIPEWAWPLLVIAQWSSPWRVSL